MGIEFSKVLLCVLMNVTSGEVNNVTSGEVNNIALVSITCVFVGCCIHMHVVFE